MSTLGFRCYTYLAAWRKRRRLLFPSPAEVQLIRIMGGKCIVVDHFQDPRSGFPLTIVTNLGRLFRRELVKREVRVGAMYIDFAVATPWYKKGIEVDGRDFHRDIVREVWRDGYLADYGWSVLHVPAASLYRDPWRVRQKVLTFLAAS
jgi:hypothetical protein